MTNELLKSLYELPDVSFIENDTLEAVMQRLVSNYEKRYQEITGKAISLGAADPMRIALYAVALDQFQTEEYVDRAGKQDLLKYSYGDFLDNLAGNRGVTRQAASAAQTTLRFHLSEIKAHAVGIPAGTRATNGDGVYFKTTEYAEAAAGEDHVDVDAICTVQGIEGNDLLPGQVDIMVDPLPYIESVENLTTTDGGAAVESDESLAERVYLAPSSYSVAGPSDAYAYWAKTYNANIGSVKPISPSASSVDVYILMADGTIPEEEMVTGLEEYLRDIERRPMTDLVQVKTPEVVEFDIGLTYYINRSDRSKAVAIQQEVAAAVTEYLSWQTSEIGRDINPDDLLQRIKAAGVKRVELTAPAFTVVTDTQVAQCTAQAVTYGGLEDD
jgi:phage-related baseplate assembly protein